MPRSALALLGQLQGVNGTGLDQLIATWTISGLNQVTLTQLLFVLVENGEVILGAIFGAHPRLLFTSFSGCFMFSFLQTTIPKGTGATRTVPVTVTVTQDLQRRHSVLGSILRLSEDATIKFCFGMCWFDGLPTTTIWKTHIWKTMVLIGNQQLAGSRCLKILKSVTLRYLTFKKTKFWSRQS